MKKRIRNMENVNIAIKKILDSPVKSYSVNEANKSLRSCGILTKNNSVRKEYKDIVIKTTKV